MSFVTLDYAKKLMELHNTPYFRVSDSSNKLTINKVENDIGIKAAQELLQETVENCEGDFVNVKLYSEPPSYREKNKLAGTIYEFKVRLINAGIPNTFSNHQSRNAAPAINGPSWQDLINLHNEKNKLDLELKLKEIEAGQKNPMNAILEKIVNNQNLMNAITGLLLNANNKKNVSNIAAPNNEQATPINAPEQINSAIKDFAEVDPDYINTLSAMAAYLKNNPQYLPQIKTIINNGQ